MNHHRIMAAFLGAISAKARNMILTNIGNHYGITVDQAYAEVTHPEAESLLDYVTGPERGAVSVLMQRAGVRA